MEICIFDLKGKHLKTIPTSYATGIACSPDGNIIYLANPVEHTVTSFTFDLDDTVRAIYKEKERHIENPSQIIVDNEGSIYVCCHNNIYHLSGDLSFGQIVTNNQCTSIAYCDQKLILGHSNFVKVFVVEG
jgi:sugar lactone lactonase YvrE